MRVDLQLGGLCLAIALSTAAHGQSFTFKPANPNPGAPTPQPSPQPAPKLTTPGSEKAAVSVSTPVIPAPAQDVAPTPNLAAMLATMSTKAPTIELLSDLQRHEREVAVAERLSKLKAATTPTPTEVPAPVKVIKPRIREPLVAQEAPLKHLLAIYGATGREEADLQMPDGSIETVHRGSKLAGFEVIALSTDSLKVNVTRQVVAKVADGKSQKQKRTHEELKTVHSTIDVPVGTAFH